MLQSSRGRSRVGTGRGLFLLAVVVCSGVLGCDRALTNPDQVPTAPTSIISAHRVNDTTYAYDVVVSDTGLLTHLISMVENPGGATPPVSILGWSGAIAETTWFSPRHNVQLSGLLPSRPTGAYYRWAVQVTGSEPPPHRDWLGDGRVYYGSPALSLSVSGIPDTMRQIGLDLIIPPRGPNPIRGVTAYVDSGSATQQAFGPVPVDSAIFTTGDVNRDFHLWVPGPLANGSHVLSFVVTDSARQTATFRKTVVVNVASRDYRIVPIAVASAIDTYGNAINNQGVIAGSYLLPDWSTQAIRWVDGVVQHLPGGSPAAGQAINDSGVVAGRIRQSGSDSIVIWRDTTRTDLAPTYSTGIANAIAANGDVLASSSSLIHGGVSRYLGLMSAADMNNSGFVVGSVSGIGAPENAVILNPTQNAVGAPYSPVYTGWDTWPHCCSTRAGRINDAGQVVASSVVTSVPFLWERGKAAYWTINPLGLGGVYGMSRGNLVLARLSDGSIAVWTIGGATTRVHVDASLWTIDRLVGINDRAQIIAHGVNKLTGEKAALLLDPL